MSPLLEAPERPEHDCEPPSDPIPPLRSTWDCACGRVWVVAPIRNPNNDRFPPGWRQAGPIALLRHKRWLRR